MVLANSCNPILFGMGFLTRDPNSFECQIEGEWKPCTKEYICENGVDRESYRPIKDDEYIDNWTSPDKFNTLCEPKWKIGLLGSMYFAGCVCTVLIVPVLADKYWGRKPTLAVNIVATILGLFGLLICTTLYEAYVFIFILGMSFPGRVFLALTYSIEFMPVNYHYSVPNIYLFSEPVFLILLTFWYQFIDHSWFLVQILMFILTLIISVYYFGYVPESPKWLYTFKNFNQSREVLKQVATFNFVDNS